MTQNQTKAKRAAARPAAGRWRLEDAKARFSEMVRHAREEGPQRVDVRGHDAVVVMSVAEFDRLAPETPRLPFVQFMENCSTPRFTRSMRSLKYAWQELKSDQVLRMAMTGFRPRSTSS
jgi:prevent-host-death family protein